MASMSLTAIETLDRVLSEVRTHSHGERLASLCFDVLSSQAEGRALYAGRRIMRVRAAAHRVSRSEADTELGNVIAILERGPERTLEWALIAAFAVRGLDVKLLEAGPGERREVVERFARHADWLELSTPFAPYRFVRDLLSDTGKDALIEALETFVLAPSEGPSLAA